MLAISSELDCLGRQQLHHDCIAIATKLAEIEKEASIELASESQQVKSHEKRL